MEYADDSTQLTNFGDFLDLLTVSILVVVCEIGCVYILTCKT